jgi:prepilin-type N-terminal cleavage/methylation domain-containing protein
MRVRKAFTLVELLVVISILIILIAIAFPFMNRFTQKAPNINGKITELRLPQDFAGSEQPAVSSDKGYLLITYTDEYGEYQTQRYGPYLFNPPKRIHWIKPEKMRER